MKLPATLFFLGLFACTPSSPPQGGGDGSDPGASNGASAPAKDAAMKEDCQTCPEAMQVSATAQARSDDLVKGITLTEYTPISKIMAAFPEYEGERVLVKGEAVAVCEKKGCWVTLKNDADNSKALRVKVEDGEIVFPLTVKGNVVEAEGIIEKVVTKEADYRRILESRAKARGETFDPASVKGDLVTWQLRGLGAKF
ncbi:MAG: hypothetical protein Fur0037_23830 [Planctomycetota bacterium]